MVKLYTLCSVFMHRDLKWVQTLKVNFIKEVMEIVSHDSYSTHTLWPNKTFFLLQMQIQSKLLHKTCYGKIVILNANTKEIITLHTFCGQIRYKLLLKCKKYKEIVALHMLYGQIGQKSLL